MQPTTRPTSTSTRPAASPNPRAQVNTQTKVLDTTSGRILCLADIRGHLSTLNELAREANAKAIIHTGDFGFFESASLDRINDRTLRHLTMYSPLIPSAQRTHLLLPDNPPSVIRSTVNVSLLSEFPLLLSGQIKLEVPVFTVWGACEDVSVLEKFRSGAYSIENLTVIDEATTRCLDVGGVKLRLLGLGGALVAHKMFDNGEGNATIAGGQGTMWTTALQIGELVDTAQRVYDQSETRLLITHASPGREGIMAQLALVLKADLTMSAGLHFRYATSYNEFSVQNDFKGFRAKLEAGKEAFDKVWDSVKGQVDKVIDDNQRILLDKALSVVARIPPLEPVAGPSPAAAAAAGDEIAWKNCWNWNLCDAAYGTLILDIKEGRVSAELKSQGFNYAYRRSATVAPTPNSSTSALPLTTNANSTSAPTKVATPAPPIDSSTPGKSVAPTPPPQQFTRGGTGPGTPKESSTPIVNGSSPANASSPVGDRAEREKAKKKDKKERKDKERAEKAEKDRVEKDGPEDKADAPTIDVDARTPAEASAAADAVKDADDLKSPATELSSGIRTPTSRKPRERNPWTIFMRMNVAVTEAELREFFGEAKGGITRVTIPPPFSGRNQRIAYVEFGDEDAMKAGLEKHAEKLKDTTPEVKQAQDREARGEAHRGGRGRGRGGFAARGLAAAGLTRGGFHGPRSNADEGSKGGDDA
ncbi:RRM domain-containing protein [Pleurotus pulmonarius]